MSPDFTRQDIGQLACQQLTYLGYPTGRLLAGQVGTGRNQWFAKGTAQGLHLRMGRDAHSQGIELPGQPGRRGRTGRHDPGEGAGPARLHTSKLLVADLAQIDVILQLGQIGGDQDQALLHWTLLDGQQAPYRSLGVGITSQTKDGLGGIGDHPFAVQGGHRLFKFVWHRKNATAGLPPLITGL